MSVFDSQLNPFEPIVENPEKPVYGARMNFSELTVGAGGETVILMNSEGQFFGGRTEDDANAYIKTDGTYKFKDGSGNTILDTNGITGKAASNLINIQGWSFSGTFSATDADTVAWSAGTITLADGTTFSISSGNTGNMTAITYIYFDKDVSTTTLQTTTTAGTAVGANKILMCVAKNESGKNATFQAFGGRGVGVLITADNIAAGTITANEIASNTITANKIATGTITANEIAANTITGNKLATSGIITQTAQIGDAVITNAKINDLSADKINAGTLTGRTVQITGSGKNVKIDSATGYVRWGYDGVYNCRIEGVDASTISIVASNNINAYCDSHDVYYEQDNDGADCHWRSYNDNLRMKLTSGGNLSIDGNYYSGGADYAEFFESVDGKEIPVGTSVVLEGDKIRPAREGEDPIGVISATSCFVGNSDFCGEAWAKKFKQDEFGRRLYEEADFWRLKKKIKLEEGETFEETSGWCDEKKPPKGAVITKEKREVINPEWDEKRKYIPRAERPEWNVVGLIGQIRVRKGQPVGSRWIKMKEISKDVDLYLVR